jgi:hypothetical protein
LVYPKTIDNFPVEYWKGNESDYEDVCKFSLNNDKAKNEELFILYKKYLCIFEYKTKSKKLKLVMPLEKVKAIWK